MRYLTKRNISIVSAALAIILGSQLLLYLAGNWFWHDPSASAASENESQDRQIAADLSNMTGVSTQQIMKLRATGLSWNEVIETLKGQDKEEEISGKADRTLSLLNGLSQEGIAQLQEAGYSDEAISEAKLIAERVQFQLTELTQHTGRMPSDASIDALEEQTDQAKQTNYKAVLDRFHLENAVQLILAWETEVGSTRQAMNEYLFILQAELEWEAYLEDIEAYLEVKDELRLQRPGEEWITMELIERDLLEAVQHSGASSAEETDNQQETVPTEAIEPTSPLPEVIIPQVKDVKPSNPTGTIMDEIRTLDPREDL